MKKIITTITVLIAMVSGAYAQNQANQSAAGSQRTNLELSNAIDISYYSTQYGGTQNMEFNSVNDYANGVTTGWQILVVRSNKNYNVSVKANAANFTYSGNTTPAPQMPISKLNVGLFYNMTGGTSSGTFNNKFAALSESPQNLISNADNTAGAYFLTRYRATPGFAYPAGTYTAEVTYTATQL